MKKTLSRWLTLQNIAILLGALYIGFQIYELPAEVKLLKERMDNSEKEIIVLKEKLELSISMLKEVKADVKQIMKDIKW